MLISLLHPSRGRPVKAFTTATQWITQANCETEHIFSLDYSDPLEAQYEAIGTLLKNDNRGVVQAVNRAAEHAKGDIFVYLSDDMMSSPNWGQDLIGICNRYSGEFMIKADDGLQDFRAEVLTVPIMSKALYQSLGYFFHPAYLSMWVDVDLYYTCQNRGAIKLHRELKFDHQHYCNHKSEKDDTYTRSDANWNHGKQVLNMRRAEGFR